MEDRETAGMRKYGESKTTRIVMATVPHVTSGLGLRKFQADGFLLTRVYKPPVRIWSQAVSQFTRHVKIAVCGAMSEGYTVCTPNLFLISL